MSYAHAERLSALDASFLRLDDENVHMHVGTVGVFEGAPLLGPDGGLDLERVRDFVAQALRRSPRYRQRLASVPVLGHPAWVDDARFNLHYHLRHTALPEPGDADALKRLAARVFSQRLDRGKPLWELWLVEGLEGGRFAVISKVHLSMLGGRPGSELLTELLAFERGGDESFGGWLPRPAPSPARLLAGELHHRAALPRRALGAAVDALRNPAASLDSLGDAARSMRETLRHGFGTASRTPLNEPIGPHRRFDWTRFDLHAVKEIEDRADGTARDVVLAVVAGALRAFLVQRGVRPDDLDFRVLLPVHVGEGGGRGPHLAFAVARLPLDEADPRRRLQRVIDTGEALEQSGQRRGSEIVEQFSEWTLAGVLPAFFRLASRQRAYNLVVANAPRPQPEASLLGARLLELYPAVPLFSNQAVGLSLARYAGGLHWGFCADSEGVPDLHSLVEAVQLEFEALRKL